ncbi:MAG: hypothetical protein PWP70_1436 [Moorella sp. (in: firmicutes)]|nr:hypothetical protein [Moorella sp. (in: firmicutes)]
MGFRAIAIRLTARQAEQTTMPLTWHQQKDENGSIVGGVKQVPGGRNQRPEGTCFTPGTVAQAERYFQGSYAED